MPFGQIIPTVVPSIIMINTQINESGENQHTNFKQAYKLFQQKKQLNKNKDKKCHFHLN